jgi:hypothetical protein
MREDIFAALLLTSPAVRWRRGGGGAGRGSGRGGGGEGRRRGKGPREGERSAARLRARACERAASALMQDDTQAMGNREKRN